MKLASCGFGAAIAILAIAGTTLAQENLEKGKTPEQLYAADCAICHKSPNGLTRSVGIMGVENFLREHYTASREAAAAIASYLKSVDQAAPPERKRRGKPTVTESDKNKPVEKKSAKREPKPGDIKTDENKPGAKADKDAGKHKKPAMARLPKSKPAEGMTSEPGDKPQPKSDDAKPADAAPKADATDTKPDASATNNKKPN